MAPENEPNKICKSLNWRKDNDPTKSIDNLLSELCNNNETLICKYSTFSFKTQKVLIKLNNLLIQFTYTFFP